MWCWVNNELKGVLVDVLTNSIKNKVENLSDAEAAIGCNDN